jgi:hypothetical protein
MSAKTYSLRRLLFLVSVACGLFAVLHWFGIGTAIGVLLIVLVGFFYWWRMQSAIRLGERRKAIYAGFAVAASVAGIVIGVAMLFSVGEHKRHAFHKRADFVMGQIGESLAADPRFQRVTVSGSPKAFFVNGTVASEKDLKVLQERIAIFNMPLATLYSVQVHVPIGAAATNAAGPRSPMEAQPNDRQG